MPSDVQATAPSAAPSERTLEPIEPPSVKLIVRLFLIPLLVAGLVIAAMLIMSLLGKMAGSAPAFDEAIRDLKNDSGGQRTAGWLVGPGAKQRYIDAKALTDQMKSGMSEPERVKLAADLIDILDHHTRPDEGEVQHFILLALGRVWQNDPSQGSMDSPAAVASRHAVLDKLLVNARIRELFPKSAAELANMPPEEQKDYKAAEMSRRKAAILAMAFWAGRDEAKAAFPTLTQILQDGTEDLDVRMAAATALGPIASPADQNVIDALTWAMNNSGSDELTWDAAGSLAQLNQPQAADTILMLLDRSWLAKKEYDDPETGAKRPLSEYEQQRILINTMQAARKLDRPDIRERFAKIAADDPSPRVRQFAKDLLDGKKQEN
jgi:hypothetical protein